MASHTMPSYLRDQPLSFFVQSSLILTQVAGSPLPPSPDDEKFQPEVRSLTGDGPLEDWEIAILILGALFGIMLLGAVGGICEVVLGGKIKKSNAEADAKLENIGKRDMTDDAEGGKIDGGGGGEGSDGVIDPSRYSWQPERMTTGLSDDSTLAGSDPGASQSDVSRGEQAMAAEGEWDGGSGDAQQVADGASQDYAETSEQYMAWNGGSLPHPDSSQFIIDDVDSPGYEGPRDNAQSYDAYPGHLNPPPAMPKSTTYQSQDTTNQYWNEGGDGTSYPDSSQARDDNAASDGSTGQSTMPPPGAYSGEGYSPAVMPDSADYLSEYRQSQLYLQQDDDCLELPARTPSHLKFAGSLPLKPLSLWQTTLEYPSWFKNDVRKAHEQGKRIVMVDYFPYDAVLQYTDIFVSASGYGGLTHAVANSVPLIQAGLLLDKADIGRRLEYSGLGIYLDGDTVSPEDVSEAVDRILQNYASFKARAMELKEEFSRYQPLQILEQDMLGFTK